MKYCKMCNKHRLSPNNKSGYCIWCINPNTVKRDTANPEGQNKEVK